MFCKCFAATVHVPCKIAALAQSPTFHVQSASEAPSLLPVCAMHGEPVERICRG